MTTANAIDLAAPGKRQGLRVTAILLAAAVGLSACDDSDGNDEANGIDSLGDDFVRAFSQNLNDEPLDASELSLTFTPGIEPFDPA